MNGKFQQGSTVLTDTEDLEKKMHVKNSAISQRLRLDFALTNNVSSSTINIITAPSYQNSPQSTTCQMRLMFCLSMLKRVCSCKSISSLHKITARQ